MASVLARTARDTTALGSLLGSLIHETAPAPELCYRSPALLIKLDSLSGPAASFSLRLIPTITADTFPLTKLTSERCNDATLGQKRKRPVDNAAATRAKKLALDTSADTAPASKAPTQHYNTSIVADVMMLQHQQAQQAAFDSMPRLSQAIVLLKVRPHHKSAG